MRPIEIQNGYMICGHCRGYIEAGDQTPACECMVEETSFSEEAQIVN